MREMKDSGIKWIGVIPSAWRTARVKNVAETMQSGGTPDSSNDTFYVDIEGGIPWVAIADMSTTPYVKDTNKHISEEGRKSKNLIVFEPGTILYAMYASVGRMSSIVSSVSGDFSSVYSSMFSWLIFCHTLLSANILSVPGNRKIKKGGSGLSPSAKWSYARGRFDCPFP